MHPIDIAILAGYGLFMIGVGLYYMRRNSGGDDYYVGGRDMGAVHIGLSVVATDVGGGFSIGLGGLGFVMGLSGSWMLFTGLVGAWLSAVILVPRVKGNPVFASALTFPDVLKHYYGRRVAIVAGVISAVGYLGFTASQVLAGAKLASGTFASLDMRWALFTMGVVVVAYTVLGGLKAVILTDTIQWGVLLVGLTFVALPVAWHAVGGWAAISATVPELLSLTNVGWQQLVNWAVTIIPIWFVGMTLYQRIHAARDEATARRAWYIAGLLEWPLMALLGVTLGLLARVAADQGMFDYLGVGTIAAADPETGLPMLLRTVLPVGALGVVLAAYFSAILSTADSCLMASSGNVLCDIIGNLMPLDPNSRRFVRWSMLTTAVLGTLALVLAFSMTNVLALMLHSYAFLVAGLLVPTLGALLRRHHSPVAALSAMVVGGGTTVALQLGYDRLWLGLDANVFGLTAALVVFVIVADGIRLVGLGAKRA